jgi:hypothetical protein
MQLQKRSSSLLPQASAEVLRAVRQRVQRTCEHHNLEPKDSRAEVYECADCGYRARSTFGRVTRWRDDA